MSPTKSAIRVRTKHLNEQSAQETFSVKLRWCSPQGIFSKKWHKDIECVLFDCYCQSFSYGKGIGH